MPFCTNCGKPVETRFYPYCGSSVSPSPYPGASPSPAADTPAPERVLGVIGGLDLKRSFLKSELVNLVITGTRTLCVPVAPLLEAVLKQAEADAKAEGKWLIGKWKAKADVLKASNFSDHFRERLPDDILREFPASIEVPQGELVSISIRHLELDFDGEDISSSAEDWPVAIKTKKAEYSLTGKIDPVQQFRLNPAVDAILGDRLKVLF